MQKEIDNKKETDGVSFSNTLEKDPIIACTEIIENSSKLLNIITLPTCDLEDSSKKHLDNKLELFRLCGFNINIIASKICQKYYDIIEMDVYEQKFLIDAHNIIIKIDVLLLNGKYDESICHKIYCDIKSLMNEAIENKIIIEKELCGINRFRLIPP